jgi:hypothetical protein
METTILQPIYIDANHPAKLSMGSIKRANALLKEKLTIQKQVDRLEMSSNGERVMD